MPGATNISSATRNDFGQMLRMWRERRRLSQIDLAGDVPLSQRHLSCLERGVAQPSRETTQRLAEVLQMPAPAVNSLFAAAGFAPPHRIRSLAEPGLEAVRTAIDRILAAHAPYPAIALDRHWTMVAANNALSVLIAGIDQSLLMPPVNALRLSLHPGGLAPRIVNLREWRAHIVHRLELEIERSGDGVLAELLEELRSYPLPPGARPYRTPRTMPFAGIAVPLILTSGADRLSFISTTTVFGTAVDIAVSGLTIETFLPADPMTAETLLATPGERELF